MRVLGMGPILADMAVPGKKGGRTRKLAPKRGKKRRLQGGESYLIRTVVVGRKMLIVVEGYFFAMALRKVML